jgi:hypothetical protein
MLRTNLATRPFYNDRAVRSSIGIGVLVVAALSAFNVAQILTLNNRNAEFVARAETAESRANQLRDQARQTRQTLDTDDITLMQAAAREANLLIERRAFSWTDLFNRFEATLPADVRIAAVQPQVDNDGRMLVLLTVFSRRVEDLYEFIEKLEQTGAFRGMLPRQEDAAEDGTKRSVLQGYYNPQAAVPATVPQPATSDPNEARPSNASPAARSTNGDPR